MHLQAVDKRSGYNFSFLHSLNTIPSNYLIYRLIYRHFPSSQPLEDKKQKVSLDVVLVGSGSIRGKEFGTVVTLEDIKKVYPYDGSLYKIKVTGAQLTKVFTHFLRPENRKPGESQCYQISKGVRVVYNNTKKAIESFSINEQPVEADRLYVICVQDYHYQNLLKSLNLTPEEIANAKVVTTSSQGVLEEYLSTDQLLDGQYDSAKFVKCLNRNDV